MNLIQAEPVQTGKAALEAVSNGNLDQLIKQVINLGVEAGKSLLLAAVIFIVGWKHVLKYMKAQPDDEFALDVAGISIEYVTEFSESDKSRNIVPQMFHLRTPVFVKQDKQTVPGFKAPNAQLESYTMWRTENLTETLEKIENDVYAELVNTFQIDTWYSVAILPIMAAVYRAGIELARASKSAVNMYNIFEIRIAPDEQIILTPLAEIKQSLKSDAVKADVPF